MVYNHRHTGSCAKILRTAHHEGCQDVSKHTTTSHNTTQRKTNNTQCYQPKLNIVASPFYIHCFLINWQHDKLVSYDHGFTLLDQVYAFEWVAAVFNAPLCEHGSCVRSLPCTKIYTCMEYIYLCHDKYVFIISKFGIVYSP